MKVDAKNVVFLILTAIVSAAMGYIGALEVQKYAIREHERIKRVEKEVLKQKIQRENQILIRRLEEDFTDFKDSVRQEFIKEKKEFYAKRGGEPPGNLKRVIDTRFDSKMNRVVAKRRKQVDRKIEDLEMRLDF